jgi:hypothetical protein
LTGGTASFATKTVGLNKTVSVIGLGPISGSLAGNYSLAGTTASATANISNALLTVTGVIATNKTYDGTTAAAVGTNSAVLVGVISGDTVTLTGSATGAFADPNTGTNKVVTVSGLTPGGSDGSNYLITPPTTTANISKAASTTTMTASPASPSPQGTTVTFKATVTGPAGTTPTGSVVFDSAGVPFSTNALAGGIATSSGNSSLPVAFNSITATYVGDTNLVGSAKSILYRITVSTGTTATPAKITSMLYGNPITISGTGPVSHPFALMSSTNVAQAMNLWTPEQTNTANTGSFSFSVTPATAKAKFFRVITQ